MQPMQIALAPDKLWQAINPWSFYLQGAQLGLVDVDLGQTARPDVERAILDRVGSYGRQIGRMGGVLEILIARLPADSLTETERDAIEVLKGQLAEIRQVKRSATAQAGFGQAGTSAA